jgi:nucleoside-diphosphate-sugar epimerase
MVKRILVTGSEGFVGRHVRRALTRAGAEVVGIDMPGCGAEIGCDLSDPRVSPEELVASVGPVAGIVHLAARITRTSSVDAGARRNVRVIAEVPVRLMEAWNQRYGPTHLVFCSSIKVYGAQARLPIAPDASPLRPEPNSYGSAKALGERLLEVSRLRGLGTCAIVRPSYVYGPGQRATTAIPSFLRTCWQGMQPIVFGDGRQLRDDVLASDVAYCLTEACVRRVEGAFNAGGERVRCLLDVAELCCRAVEAVGGPRGLSPALDATRAPAPWVDQSFDSSRTRVLLDYEPAPLLEGLMRQARWMRDGADTARAVEYTWADGRR